MESSSKKYVHTHRGVPFPTDSEPVEKVEPSLDETSTNPLKNETIRAPLKFQDKRESSIKVDMPISKQKSSLKPQTVPIISSNSPVFEKQLQTNESIGNEQKISKDLSTNQNQGNSQTQNQSDSQIQLQNVSREKSVESTAANISQPQNESKQEEEMKSPIQVESSKTHPVEIESFNFKREPNSRLDYFLNNTLCSSSLFPQRVTYVKSTDSMADAFRVLSQAKVQSVPVLHEGRVAFIVTFQDIVRFVLENFTEADIPNVSTKKNWTWKFSAWIRGAKTPDSLDNTTIGEFAASNRKLPTPATHLDIAYLIKARATLGEAVELMIRTNAHRLIVVTDSEEKLAGVISQSRLLELFSEILVEDPILDKKLSELKLKFSSVVFVRGSETAYRAFEVMSSYGVSSVPIVDNKGVLIGQISATDIKLVGYKLEFFEWLTMTCKQYVEMIRDQIHSEIFALLKDGVAQCRLNWSLEGVLKLFSRFKVHRVFVTDDEGKPIGVLSVCSVFKLFIRI